MTRQRLTTLRRKCRLLAARLRTIELEDWVRHEQDGYPNETDLPDYRTWPLVLRGSFVGTFGAQVTNHKIPFAVLPAEIAAKFKVYKCRESIASIESLLGSTKGPMLQVDTGNLPSLLHEKVINEMECMSVWGEFGQNQLYSLLDRVRNRILDFACRVQQIQPDAGEISVKVSPEHSNQITQIFNTTVYGGSPNIGTVVTKGDFEQLRKALTEKGVAEDDIKELEAAVAADPVPSKPDALGPRVSGWIGKMATKAASGAWTIGTGAGVKVVTELLTKYLGF